MSDHAHAPALGRRRLTAALLSVPLVPVLAACDDDDVVDLPGLPPVGPDPDEPLLDAALEAEGTLMSAVADTRRRHPEVRALLRSAHEVHGAHVDLLFEAAGEEGSFATVTPAGVPRSPRVALETLARQEQRLAAQHVQRAVAARSGPFARLMAVLAAAATQQSVLLAQAAAELPKGRRS